MSLLLGALFALGTLGLGLGLLRLARGPGAPVLDGADLGLGAALGLAALSLAALALALLGGLRPLPLVVVLGAGAVLALARLGQVVSALRGVGSALGGVERVLVALIGVHTAGNLLRALAPSTAWDALAYHLALARAFAGAGGFVDLPTIRMSPWPLGLDLLFAVGETLGDGALSGFVAWWLGVVATLVTAGLASRLGGVRAGVLAAALWAGAPVVALVSGMAYIEAGLAAWAGGALLATVDAGSGRGRGSAALAGLLAGAAAGAKYTALAFPLLVALGLALRTREWRSARVALAVAVAVAAPAYLRTAAVTGNPLWPYAWELLGGRDWSAAHAERLASFERGYGGAATAGLGQLVRLPYAVVFRPGELDGLLLGPAFLALAPLALAGRDRRRTPLLVFLAGGAVAWLATSWQVRFLVPLLPAAAAAIAAGAASGRFPLSARAATVVAGAVAVGTTAFLVPSVRAVAPVLLGRERPEQFLARTEPLYRAMSFVNCELRPRRILLWRELRGYWLEVPYLWGDPTNQAVVDYRNLADPEALRARLVELEVDAVLVNAAQYPPGDNEADRRTWALVDALLERFGEAAYRDGPIAVYRLRAP